MRNFNQEGDTNLSKSNDHTILNEINEKINKKFEELKNAKKLCDKYLAPVPISVASPEGHSLEEMTKDYENYNRLEEDYFALQNEKLTLIKKLSKKQKLKNKK